MDAGFFRVSRSAGSWGRREARGWFVGPDGGLRLGPRRPAEGGLEDPEGPVASAPGPRRCGRDRCASAQSPPPGSSPLRGGGGGRKMAAGMGRSGASRAA